MLNQLLIPDSKEFKAVNWEHVVSLTSYPERFNTLSQTLNSLLAQRLIAKKIYLNIAQEDMSKLPASVKDFASSGLININACENLGPGKKLIPTLKLEKNLPIIVVDDDLIFEYEYEGNHFSILIDSMTIQYLKGSTVDCKQKENERMLTITNPNAAKE